MIHHAVACTHSASTDSFAGGHAAEKRVWVGGGRIGRGWMMVLKAGCHGIQARAAAAVRRTVTGRGYPWCSGKNWTSSSCFGSFGTQLPGPPKVQPAASANGTITQATRGVPGTYTGGIMRRVPTGLSWRGGIQKRDITALVGGRSSVSAETDDRVKTAIRGATRPRRVRIMVGMVECRGDFVKG